MIKKFFKIFQLKPDFYGVYQPTYSLLGTHFFSLKAQPTHEECESMIAERGVLRMQYVIVEVLERESE